MPGVFSIGAFKTQDASLTLTVELKTFFANLLDTMRNWVEKAHPQIIDHNKKTDDIKKEVLMSMQEQIQQGVAKAHASLIEENKKISAENKNTKIELNKALR